MPAVADVRHGALTVHDTPDTPTIASLVDLANQRALEGRTDWTAADTLKNVVVTVHHPGRDDELLVIGVPGDRDVDLKRLDAVLSPATATMFDDFASRPDLVKGYIGPQGIKARYLADPRVAPGTAWLTGAERARPARDLGGGRPRLHAGRHDRGRRGAGRRSLRRVRCRRADHPARHRDRPHLPARPALHRRVQGGRAGRRRQAGPADHGLLRHRDLPRGRGDRRAAPRRPRPDLAGRGGAGRRARGRGGQGRPGRGRAHAGAGARRDAVCGCSSTIGPTSPPG